MDIQTAFSHCIADLGLAKNTARTYQNGLNCFATYLKEQNISPADPVGELDIDHFIYFLPWLNESYAKQTAGVYGAATKALLDWMVIEKYLEPSYSDGVRLKKAFLRSHKRHEDKLPREPKETDVPRMLEAVRAHQDFTPKRERDIALIEVLIATGCRISELIALNIEDIDFESKSAIVTGKGSKERRVFFSAVALEALREYWTARKSSMVTDPVFGRHDKGAGKKRIKRMTTATARNIVNEIAIIAGIDTSKISPHYFRHDFAIRVLEKTGNLALAQDLLGHKDPKSTRVYAKIRAKDLQAKHQEIFG